MSEQQTNATVAGAVTAAAPAWGKALAVVAAIVTPLVLAWLTGQRDTPTVVKEIGHDPAEDAWRKRYEAAKAAGLVAGVDG